VKLYLHSGGPGQVNFGPTVNVSWLMACSRKGGRDRLIEYPRALGKCYELTERTAPGSLSTPRKSRSNTRPRQRAVPSGRRP
jgi:hypothetical protein